MAATLSAWLADLVLVLHFALVAFVVGGLVAIIVGNLLGWTWVNRWWLRALHLAAIAVVAAQAWLGQDCPLTILEQWLRAQAGGPVHAQSFVGYWLQRWLFYEAPAWVFITAYSVFGLAVAAAWWRYPPRRRAAEGRPDRPSEGSP